MTIRKRLTLWYAVLLTVIIILFGAITYGVMRYTMIRNLDAALRETAHVLAVNSRLVPAVTFGLPPGVIFRMAEIDVFRASGVHVQAWNLQLEPPALWGRSASLASVDVPLDPNTLGYSGAGGKYSYVTLYGVNLRVLTTPIYSGNRLVGNLQVAADLATVNQAAEQFLLVTIFSSIIAIIGAVALSLWFSHRALEPIERITHAASNVAAASDLSTRLDWDGPQDELGRLISVFNQMMARIEHLFSVQQRFVADISHELRTPLTTIQGNLELARRYGLDDESREAMECETQRMARLVNDLLMLARADTGGIVVDLYPVDLDTIVLETIQQSSVLAQGRDLNIHLGQFEPVRINGNTDRIRQLLLNLLNNAIKFTPDGGEITISLERQGDQAMLRVQDTGIGVAPEDRERIFDRFYQSDPARTHTGGGFGLGLSIAKWIVEAHHGSIRVESDGKQGTTFIVLIPTFKTPDAVDVHSQPTRPRIPIIRWNRGDEAHSPNGAEGKKEHLPNQERR